MRISKKPLAVIILALMLATSVLAEDYPLDLSGVANMGFKDDVARDGKGGWSDQGSEDDARDFDLSKTDYEGLKFQIVNPDKNNGKAVVTFDSPQASTGVKTVTLDLSKQNVTGRFLYLLHTTCWNQHSLGTVEGFVEVVFDDGTKLSKDICSGIDVSDWYNPSSGENSLVAYKKKMGNVPKGIFLSKFDFYKRDRNAIKSITFTTTGRSVWILVGATFSSLDVDLNEKKLVFVPNSEWKPVDNTKIQVQEGSALDLSALTEAGPAGKHGRLIIGKNDGYAFENSPGVERRFLCLGFYKAPIYPEPEKIALYAKLIKRQGYDSIRPLVLENFLMGKSTEDGKLSSASFEIVDRFFSELKANGIYVNLTIGAYRLGFAESAWKKNDYRQRMYIGEPRIRANWKAVAEEMLNHVNPYTKLAWKDDPMFVTVEFYNEQEWGMCNLNTISPETRKLFNVKWRAWLLAKYKTAEALASSWGQKNLTEPGVFEKLEIPNNVDAFGSQANDFGLFFRELALENMAWCERVVRDAGYKGLITQYNCSKLILDGAVRWQTSPVVSMNTYFQHPTSHNLPGSKCGQGSSLENAADYWRDGNSTRLSGRPFYVSEYNHSFWNQYQHEGGLVFPAYSALHGYSALCCWESTVKLEPTILLGDFNNAENPIARANEFLSACLYKRGDVKKAPHRVELRIPSSFVNSNANGNKAVNTEQSKIALMTGFSLSFPDIPLPKTCPKLQEADLVIPPAEGAKVWGVNLAATQVENSSGTDFSLQDFVTELKRKGILPISNISDPAAGVYESETGEIVLRSREKLIKVVTPKTEGVSLEAGKGEKLENVVVNDTTVPATIAVCSMDDKTVDKSSRMILIYSTEAVNTGMELSIDRVTLRKTGTTPPLMRCGKLAMTIKNSNASKLSFYALGLDGTRKERLPLSIGASESGKEAVVKISLDTSKLKESTTPFFELVSE